MKCSLPAMVARLVMATVGAASAADQITIQLLWVTQAQFAGYYVAKGKSFYKDVDLAVTIKPSGPSLNTEQALAAGEADVIVDWLTLALVAREKGIPLVNISQTFQRSSHVLTCLKSSGIRSPADFRSFNRRVAFRTGVHVLTGWQSSTFRLTVAPKA